MDSTHARPSGGISLTATVLIAGSLMCGALAWWAMKADVVSLLAKRIGAAQGSTATEALEYLRTLDFSLLLTGVAILLAAAGFLMQRFGLPALQRFLLSDRTITGGSQNCIVAIVCGAVILARYFPTLSHGYFRYDDFDFLVVAREYPLAEAIWIPHGDHFYPLTRALASFALHCFGTVAWPYNLGVLLCFWITAILGCGLLRELNVSYQGQAIFVVLFLFWSPWAEMLGGYYILSAYLLIAALGIASILGYLRWRKTNTTSAAATALVCAGTATLVDISGWYVPPALAVFVVADLASVNAYSRREWFVQHARLFAGFMLVMGLSLTVTVLCYTVFYPGSFLSMSGAGGNRTLGRLLAEFVYLFDAGLLVSIAVPFIYARLPLAVLAVLSITAFLLFISFVAAACRAADRRQRLGMAAIFLVIAGSALMVNIGRPSGETIVVRWAAKHVCPAYLWLCLLLAAAWHVLWTSNSRRRLLLGEVTLVSLGLFLFAQTSLGALGLAVSFPPFGYPAEIRDAKIRRHSVDGLRQVLTTIKAETDGNITIPTLDGEYIRNRHTSLFDYNLSCYLPLFDAELRQIRFVRNSAMQSAIESTVTTVPVLRTAVSPAFIELIQRHPTVRDYYTAKVALQPLSISGRSEESAVPEPARLLRAAEHIIGDGCLTFTSDGTTALVIRDSAFAPEELPHLYLQIESAERPESREFEVEIAFRSDIGTGSFATWATSGTAATATTIDLRQIYAFALSERVYDLQIRFTRPGSYRVRMAELRRDATTNHTQRSHR